MQKFDLNLGDPKLHFVENSGLLGREKVSKDEMGY
jgi:hypothetical protein